MDSGVDSESNIDNAINYIRSSRSEGADWILLPEMFSFMGPYDDLKKEAISIHSERFKVFQGLAKELGIVLFLGTIPEPSDDDKKVYNTFYVIGRDGNVLAKYRKTHLFNLNGDDKRNRYCESDGYIQGDDLVTINIDGYNVHLTVCYDIRFSGLFNALQKIEKADVIMCPSAFTEATGKRHWHTLMKSRAIEYQCYVVASSQTGTKKNGKSNYGHALVYNPWGTLLVDTKKNPGYEITSISKEVISSHRKALPILSNSRPELY